MVNFLAKLFIKDYRNIESEKVRNKYGVLAGVFGIISNFILFVIKIIIGLISASISIIADAINNFNFEENLWNHFDSAVLFGNIIFAGWDSSKTDVC